MAAPHADDLRRLTKGWSRGGQLQRELKRLPTLLDAHERLVDLDRAEVEGGTGLLAVTDQRVVFVRDDGLLLRSEKAHRYEDMVAVKVEDHFFGGSKLTLVMRETVIELRKLDAERAERVCAYVEARMLIAGSTGASVTSTSPGDSGDPVADVKRLLGGTGLLAIAMGQRLREVLWSHEQVGAVAYGLMAATPGLILATTHRVLFVGRTADQDVAVTAVSYDDIKEVRLRGASSIQVIVIATSIGKVRLGPVPPVAAKVVVAFADRQLSVPRAAVRAAPPQRAVTVPVPVPVPVRPKAPKRTSTSTAPVKPLRPVDVNVVTAQELQDALGLPKKTAVRAIALRAQLGEFTDAAHFADALELAPHVRRRVTPLVKTGRGPEAVTPEPAPETSPPVSRPRRADHEIDPH
jgi:hypothetical protein